MGCGAWLRFDGGDGDLVAPGFESDSKAFGNWLAGVLVDARARAALDSDGTALLTIQAEWLEAADRWTTPEALVGAAETTRRRLESNDAGVRRLLEIYRACGYGGDPASELAADLRDVERMARWALQHQLSRVAFRVDYPDRDSPSGLAAEDVAAAVRERIGGVLKRSRFAVIAEEPPRYVRIRDGIPIEVSIEGDEYANELRIKVCGALPFFPPLFREQHARDTSRRTAGHFSFRSLEELHVVCDEIATLIPGVVARAEILAGCSSPAEEIAELLGSDHYFAKIAASSERVAPVVLRPLRELGEDICAAIARNARASAEILRELAGHSNADIRADVAAHENVEPDVLARFGEDAAHAVLMAVARNRRTPRDILERLATGTDLAIRSAVLHNAGLTQEAAARITRAALGGGSEDERVQIARTSKDAAVLSSLVEDASDAVRAALCRNPAASMPVLRDVLDRASLELRTSLAAGPKTRPEVLGLLVLDPEAGVRIALASCPHKVVDVYDRLSHDESVVVRQALARRVGMGAAALGPTGKKILARLANDSIPSVKEEAERALAGRR